MKKILNRIYCLEEKIGKQNFILLGFITVFIIITGLYQTFSLYTSSEGVSLLDGIKTYKFILGTENVENSVTVAAGSSKNVSITVSNQDKIKLKYGIYYTSSDILTDVDLGYKWDTDYLPNGLIDSNQDYIVTIQIDNNSSSDITISFGIMYGLESGGDLVPGENQHFLEKKWRFPLNEVEAGSYVAYQGNNGCTGESCNGQNANYVSDSDMGYCHDVTYKFKVNGWRVGYIQNENVYLISAGATECVCTNSNGTISADSCSTSESTFAAPIHLSNLNNISLKYCNPDFVKDGDCANNVWAVNESDFKKLTGSGKSLLECHDNSTEKDKCGEGNDLVDNGGNYWYANAYSSTSSNALFGWNPLYHYLSVGDSSHVFGVRPVIRLDNLVVVTSGTGTYEDPYQITNSNPIKLTVQKMSSETEILSDTWSDEGLNFTLENNSLNQDKLTVYYCQDTENTCTPNIVATSGTNITDYNSINGIYYFRYQSKYSNGFSSEITSFTAKVDTQTPVITMNGGTYEFGITNSIASVSWGPSSGKLSCVDTSYNNQAMAVNYSFEQLGHHIVSCTATSNAGKIATATDEFNVGWVLLSSNTHLSVTNGGYKDSNNNIILPQGGIQYGPYVYVLPGCYQVIYWGNNLHVYPSGYVSYNTIGSVGTGTFTISNLNYLSSDSNYVVKIPSNSDAVEFKLTNNSTYTITVTKISIQYKGSVNSC